MIDWLILVLFLFLMVRTYRRRKDTTTDVGFSFRLGLLLFLAVPTDILTMFTVGASLTRHGQPWWHGLPFVLVTRLLVGLPLLDLLLLGKRGEDLLPKVRDWMTNNSWVISEIVLVFFLALTISSLFSWRETAGRAARNRCVAICSVQPNMTSRAARCPQGARKLGSGPAAAAGEGVEGQMGLRLNAGGG